MPSVPWKRLFRGVFWCHEDLCDVLSSGVVEIRLLMYFRDKRTGVEKSILLGER